MTPNDIDAVKLAFNPGTLIFLSIALGLALFWRARDPSAHTVGATR